ncbi:hypothetical protein GALL_10920 [mine drainage metagenome]|uniref:Class I SAM-dependent methyltransferase n=1 Tax=mine drainage metagenome TaxID=410659 RepID=A0A1J5TR71_9ZZZZ
MRRIRASRSSRILSAEPRAEMIREFLEHLLTPCPRRWRRMGYLREQIAIDARLARNRGAWAPHLEATRREIIGAMEAPPQRRCALILGAGLHHDVPLEALARRYDRVVLADLVHRPRARRAARRVGGRVVCAEFDASGVAARMADAGRSMDAGELAALVGSAHAGIPPECGGEPDLVVSANLCSQLFLLPLDWARVDRFGDEGLGRRLAAAAAGRHLDWLEERPGTVLLVSDFERRRITADGREILRETVPGLEGLRAPDRRWTWRIAPIPEHSRTCSLEHEVGAWLAAGGARRRPFRAS